MPQALIRLVPRGDVEAAIAASTLPLTIEDYAGVLLVKTSDDPKDWDLRERMFVVLQQIADRDAGLCNAATAARAASPSPKEG